MNYNSMMKKTYETPSTKGFSLVPRKIVCTSPDFNVTNPFGDDDTQEEDL